MSLLMALEMFSNSVGAISDEVLGVFWDCVIEHGEPLGTFKIRESPLFSLTSINVSWRIAQKNYNTVL